VSTDRLDEGLEQTWSPGWAAFVLALILVEAGVNAYVTC
jgi:hypothetical protein